MENDLNALFLLLGGVSLLVGALGIANVTLVSVLERVGEIGLRRALGAARRHIAAQFLIESTVMGLLGGIIGTSLGMLVVVAVAASRTWTPVLDPWVPLAAPLVGALIGLLSGTYPVAARRRDGARRGPAGRHTDAHIRLEHDCRSDDFAPGPSRSGGPSCARCCAGCFSRRAAAIAAVGIAGCGGDNKSQRSRGASSRTRSASSGDGIQGAPEPGREPRSATA